MEDRNNTDDSAAFKRGIEQCAASDDTAGLVVLLQQSAILGTAYPTVRVGPRLGMWPADSSLERQLPCRIATSAPGGSPEQRGDESGVRTGALRSGRGAPCADDRHDYPAGSIFRVSPGVALVALGLFGHGNGRPR
jgi:hypothetical protein